MVVDENGLMTKPHHNDIAKEIQDMVVGEDGMLTKLHHNDILFGRGAFYNEYVGNVNYRKLVGEKRWDYQSAGDQVKKKIVDDLLLKFNTLEPPARFLS